ncbi:hypothetical protein B0H67DRAFT_492327 [Lasiosphaeris hirsuta]|uniref:SET domain-containing protein n=1 Tax=Lasiosphaeris hirsuta TaxID=260670 RepID=A0AA40DPX3_9PEZI|nr:hypothetical protein B0H67DRAFT_492327 [Lasiosphaeris hirsuta]
MAWGRRSLVRVLLLGLVAQLAIAEAEGGADDAPAAGSSEGLAYEAIEKTDVYTGNATAEAAKVAAAPKTAKKINAPVSPPVQGWWESKICSGAYCVYTNLRIANGRGLAMVSKFSDYQKMERVEDHINKGENKFEDPSLFAEAEVVDKGTGLTASKNLRRGKNLMSWSPVLVVHKDLFKDVKKKDRRKLLEAAVGFLPDATRAVFDRQRTQGLSAGEDRKRKSIEDILLGAPWEINLGYEDRAGEHAKHYVNYPEAAVLGHDCRPNVAAYIDNHLALRATVARRTQAGEELTISYIDPLLARNKRQKWVQKHRGLGKPCGCQACTAKGSAEELLASDERVKELTDILAELKNHDSKGITEEKIDRFLALLDEERLHAKLAEGYEYAALNYNYLGLDAKAKKYADLAVQAGIIEGGIDSNDVVANRIFASDIKGHWSHRFTLKRRGQ